MAYQNIGSSPRIYVNVLEYMAAMGIRNHSTYQSLDPATSRTVDVVDTNILFQNMSKIPLNCVFMLGHDWPTSSNLSITLKYDGNNINPILGGVNQGVNTDEMKPSFDGWSLALFDDVIPEEDFELAFPGGFNMEGVESKLNSIIVGRYFNLNAPNLNLTMTTEIFKSKEITSITGCSIQNTMESGVPKWGDLPAWELSDGTESNDWKGWSLSRKNRKQWKLTFSYLDQSEMWGPNQSLANYLHSDTGYDSSDIDNDVFNFNILTDDSFFTMWHLLVGGTNKFIFQPDGDGDTLWSGNNNPDNFYVCRFANKSISATEVAYNLYNISIIIEEAY